MAAVFMNHGLQMPQSFRVHLRRAEEKGRGIQIRCCFAGGHIWRVCFAGWLTPMRFRKHVKFLARRHLNVSAGKTRVYGTAPSSPRQGETRTRKWFLQQIRVSPDRTSVPRDLCHQPQSGGGEMVPFFSAALLPRSPSERRRQGTREPSPRHR